MDYAMLLFRCNGLLMMWLLKTVNYVTTRNIFCDWKIDFFVVYAKKQYFIFHFLDDKYHVLLSIIYVNTLG